jgi:lysophospholipase L1-like esterase
MRDNEAARAAVAPGLFVDLIALLADGEGRVPLLTPTGELISEDGGHLTRAGARFVGQKLFEHPLMAPFRE